VVAAVVIVVPVWGTVFRICSHCRMAIVAPTARIRSRNGPRAPAGPRAQIEPAGQNGKLQSEPRTGSG